ncbi:50S ribosomal protein L44e [Candidatus Marsarchaeota archaeon]|jgi:large subunit ribosomal protein L44e|nr:50S ribosomal protein L44e [Candidatus Marsarchaeota archaeon]MCL5092343.1 50S ribosomal protein L44e [Candidatus Marsarchaeota archaeon]
MKVPREIKTFCPKCGKNTNHKVILYSKKPESGLNVGKRRRARKLKGYIGKVKGQATVVKVSKRQKVLLECKDCKYKVERVLGSRTKKKLEFGM